MAQDATPNEPSPQHNYRLHDIRSVCEDALVDLSQADGLDAELAFQVLRERHQGHLIGLLFSRGICDPDWEDVAQEIWIRLWEKRREYHPGRSSWWGWAVTVARHLVTDFQRTKLSKKRGIRRTQHLGEESESTPVRDRSPDQEVIAVEVCVALRDCIENGLTQEQKTMLREVDLGARTAREVAAELGHGGDDNWAHRVRREAQTRLKICLERKGFHRE